MLRLIAATRLNAADFQQSLLGRSLTRLGPWVDVRAEVVTQNTAGLPDVYNAAILRADEGDTLALLHDDVWIDDWFLPQRIDEGLARFDVIGVAGTARRLPRQPAWGFVDTTWRWDNPEHLSGAVAHGRGGEAQVTAYGPTPRPAVLLDGLFLALRVAAVRKARVQFDPQFRFHFYDLDFCRSCERAGLTMGTWPIALTHASGGSFSNPAWLTAYQTYLAKWGE